MVCESTVSVDVHELAPRRRLKCTPRGESEVYAIAGEPALSSAMEDEEPPRNATVSTVHVGVFAVQEKPFPVKPARHAHDREPVRLVHVALTLQPPLLVRHSLRSTQLKPSPVKPLGHEQKLAPVELVHVAFDAQPPLFTRHSLVSEQVTPSPEKPAEQVQVRPPDVLVHVALLLQPPLPVRHSLRSLHEKPSPTKPVGHVQMREVP